MENANSVLQTSVMNDGTNRVLESSETSHNTALSFVSGPTFTAGSVPSVTLQGSPATYIPIQVGSPLLFQCSWKPHAKIFLCFSQIMARIHSIIMINVEFLLLRTFKIKFYKIRISQRLLSKETFQKVVLTHYIAS